MLQKATRAVGTFRKPDVHVLDNDAMTSRSHLQYNVLLKEFFDQYIAKNNDDVSKISMHVIPIYHDII